MDAQMHAPLNERCEWLEADGLGGFASGTVTGVRTRRYHALLLTAATPPTGRQVLVAGLDAEIAAGGDRIAISSQRYSPGVIHPDGVSRIETFSTDPWPRWTYRLGDDLVIEYSVFVPKGLPVTVLRWRALTGTPHERIELSVRPFLAGRDYHSTHDQNGGFRFQPEGDQANLRWTPYDGVQAIAVLRSRMCSVRSAACGS
jgi:predicted glycogen debranching enzyme